MSDPALIDAATKAADLKGLELLHDYTKFHIGFYLTLATGFITIASLKKGDGFLLDVRQRFVWGAMICFMVAGFAGGVIVSSITQCYGLDASLIPNRCSSSAAFLKKDLGPLELRWFSGLRWTQLEHVSFWAGLALALFSFKRRETGDNTDARAKPLDVKVSGSIRLEGSDATSPSAAADGFAAR